jgi:hypothetical protein
MRNQRVSRCNLITAGAGLVTANLLSAQTSAATLTAAFWSPDAPVG